jgi:heme/copper-type cytochrome/quinol oxidase subunit 1
LHSLVRRYIKTAIAFLAVGLIIGVWMIARRELFQAFPSPYIVSAHTHALFVGFVMEMILGVALWLFPRPAKNDRRYDARLAEVAYWILTCSTSGRIAGELLRAGSDAVALRVFVLACGAAQAAALLLFFHTIWSRIRPLGSASREAKGERF